MLSTDFRGKVGISHHHNLDSTGNSGIIVPGALDENSDQWVPAYYLPETPFIERSFPVGYQQIRSYSRDIFGQSVSEGWPYINIATSKNKQRLHVKFYVDNVENFRKMEWDFGDGSPKLVTINREVEHIYDLRTQDTWMTKSGILPIFGLHNRSGHWADVTLSVYGPSGYDYASNSKAAFVYKLDDELPYGGPWQGVDDTVDPDTQQSVTIYERYQCQINTGAIAQAIVL